MISLKALIEGTSHFSAVAMAPALILLQTAEPSLRRFVSYCTLACRRHIIRFPESFLPAVDHKIRAGCLHGRKASAWSNDGGKAFLKKPLWLINYETDECCEIIMVNGNGNYSICCNVQIKTFTVIVKEESRVIIPL